MQKILIDINVPGAGEHFEVRVSTGMRIHMLTELLRNAFDRLVDEDFDPTDAVLCQSGTGEMIDINMTVGQAGIMNGSELLLI